jgi:hypothetical protein
VKNNHAGNAIEVIDDKDLIEPGETLGSQVNGNKSKHRAEKIYDSEGKPHLENSPESIVNTH